MHSPVCSHVLMEACSPGTAGTTRPCIPETYTISKDSLLDKIKGGWAGQGIGCTYGGPTEFKYCGTMIQDYVPIEWYDGTSSGGMTMCRDCMTMFTWISLS